jgi:hypothetical protein
VCVRGVQSHLRAKMAQPIEKASAHYNRPDVTSARPRG